MMKRLILAVGVAAVALCAGGVWPVASASRMSRPDKARLVYQRDHAGAATLWDAQWSIAPGAAGRIGVIVAAAVCGGDAFLLDRQLAAVHRVDLGRGAIVGDLGASGADAHPFREVTGLAADCERRMLYVVDKSGVASVDMDGGGILRRFSKPDTFVNSPGAVLDVGAQTLSVPGLWPAAASDWLVKPIDRMFEGDRVGYQLDLRSGRTAPLVPAVERGCWSLGPNCLFASLDAVNEPGAAWVAAHEVGTMVGVYDRSRRLVRTIDVRSNLFLDTGDRNGSQSIERMVAWNEENSVIRDCYAFGDEVVTVHSFNRTRGWKAGQRTEFDVFMNVHTLDGAGVASDIRLPDLPVGRDATSLYVVDYGPGGRRVSGRDPISLLRIPMTHR
jgi:hypothetical protein